MPEPPRDHHQALGTAPIFDDAVYCSEALNLPVNQTEDDLDAELALLARESGIADPYRFLCLPHTNFSRALSTVTLDSDHRSSMSIHSQETQSTSITSAPSRTSRDHVYSSERTLAQRTPPKPTPTPSTIDNHDQAMDTTQTDAKQRHSSSTLSVAPSVLSSSSASSSTPAPRRKRASVLFGMFKKDSR